MLLKNPWLKVAAAVIFEPMWVLGMKHANNAFFIALTIFALIASFFMLLRASEQLPVGTVYAIFVGLGTVATIIANWLFFHETLGIVQLILIAVLLFGVIGLKLMEES